MKTIQVRRTRHTGHSWRSRDERISDVLLCTPTYGRAKAGRPAKTYIQQLCEDTGCSPEDLPEAMNDRKKWREKVRDIRASSTTWWCIQTWFFFLCRLFFPIMWHQSTIKYITANCWFHRFKKKKARPTKVKKLYSIHLWRISRIMKLYPSSLTYKFSVPLKES